MLVFADGRYTFGSFNGTKFTEESPRHTPDIGGAAFYATQSFHNVDTGDGRRIQLAWMRGSDFPGQPFSQQVTFPCELKLKNTPDGLRLYRLPVREIAKLAGEVKTWNCETYAPGKQVTVSESGEAFRIEADIEIPAGSTLIMNIRGTELRLGKNSLQIGDRSGSITEDVRKMEILVDRASVETFVNDGLLSCTTIMKPAAPGISLRVEGGEATLHSLRRTELKGMWPQESAR